MRKFEKLSDQMVPGNLELSHVGFTQDPSLQEAVVFIFKFSTLLISKLYYLTAQAPAHDIVFEKLNGNSQQNNAKHLPQNVKARSAQLLLEPAGGF